MPNAPLRDPGLRYDPPQLTLDDAHFDDAATSYTAAPVRVMQPRSLLPEELGLPEGSACGPNPYVDYARRYTAEGGIELSYKTEEMSFWMFLLRAAIVLAVMGMGSWLLFSAFAQANACPSLTECTYSRDQWGVEVIGCIAGLILAVILLAPSHGIHTIEIRPDCLIIDGSDVFWTAHMEARPTFRNDELDGYTLHGIYGTRYMDFLTLRPVDENDATPAVLANHIEDALKQLWDKPQVWAGD